MNLFNLFLTFIVSAIMGIMVYDHFRDPHGVAEKHLACQIGYRLATIKYKAYKIDSVEKIKIEADLKCQDWVIEGFIERHKED